MQDQWTSADKVQKNDAGEYRAFIAGQWVPASKAQKSATGEYRVILSEQPLPITPAFLRQAAISSWRGENPIVAGVADVAGGMSGLMRGGVNLAGEAFGREKLGEKFWPTEIVDRDSGAFLAGTVADPVAWTGAGAVLRALPYAKVLGSGFRPGAKAVASNVAGGTAIAAGIGALSEDSTALEMAPFGAAFAVGLPLAIGGVRKGYGALHDLVTGARANVAGGRILRDVLGENLAKTRTAWATAQDNLTAAQAAGKSGSYELAALADVSRKYRPGAFDSRTDPQFAANVSKMAAMAGGRTQEKTALAQRQANQELNAMLDPMRRKTLDAANVPMQQKHILQDALEDTNKTINHAWQQIREVLTLGAQQSSRGAATGVKLPDLPTTGLPGVDAARASQNLSYAVSQNAGRSLPYIQGVKRQLHYDVTDSANAAAGEFATAMTAAKGTRAVLERQIGAMPDPIDVNAIRAAIARQANRAGDSANPIVVKTLEGFDNFILKLADKNNGQLDAYDVHGLRKHVNDMVEVLFEGADKATKARAATVINGLKPAIDAEIKRAAGLQGKRWDTWLTKFSDGKHTIDQQKMAAHGMELLQKNTTAANREFVALVRGNNKELVDEMFGTSGKSFFQNMGNNAKPMLEIAKGLERDLMLADRSGKSQIALARILEKDAIKVRLPALIDAKIAVANRVIDVMETRMNRSTLDAVYKAMETPKGALKLIQALPASERIPALKLLEAKRLVQGLSVGGIQVTQQNE